MSHEGSEAGTALSSPTRARSSSHALLEVNKPGDSAMPRTPSSNLFIAEIVAENEEETDEAGEAGEDDTLDIPSAQPPSSRASHRVAKRKVQSSAESDRQRPAKRAKSSNGSKQASSHATKRKVNRQRNSPCGTYTDSSAAFWQADREHSLLYAW